MKFTQPLRIMLMATIMGGLIIISLSELNPDWLSYQVLFESGGAWLSDTGRDPAFIWLIEVCNLLLGPDGYEDFRNIVSIYFFIFSILLVSGHVLPYSSLSKFSIITPTAAVALLGLTRFTIQIREGLAISFALIALSLLINPRISDPNPINLSNYSFRPRIFAGWIIMVFSSLMHASVFFFLIATVIACVYFPPDTDTAKPQQAKNTLIAIWIFGLLVAVVSATQAALGGALEGLASTAIGDRLAEERDLTLAQMFFWTLYGGICFALWRTTQGSISESKIPVRLHAVMKVIAGPFIFSVYLCIILSLLMQVSSLIITNYVRLLHFFLAIICTLLALQSPKKKTIFLCCIFLISDQIRSIIESISIYFGIEIF